VRARLVLALAGIAAACVTAPGNAAQQSRSWIARPATYGVAVSKYVPIMMSDGNVLTANVFRPPAQSQEGTSSGSMHDWWIEIRPIAARLGAGSVLRRSLQPADGVRFLPAAPALTGTAGSLLSFDHDTQHPSMPVIPATP
jgi:hypothetical protein